MGWEARAPASALLPGYGLGQSPDTQGTCGIIPIAFASLGGPGGSPVPNTQPWGYLEAWGARGHGAARSSALHQERQPLPMHAWCHRGAPVSPRGSLVSLPRVSPAPARSSGTIHAAGWSGLLRVLSLWGIIATTPGTRDVVERGGEAGWLLSCLGAGLYKPQSAPE